MQIWHFIEHIWFVTSFILELFCLAWLNLDLDLSENPVADKRLLKLIQQCRTKQVLDYVKQHGEDSPKSQNGAESNQKSVKTKKSRKSETADEPKYKIHVKRHTDDTVKV